MDNENGMKTEKDPETGRFVDFAGPGRPAGQRNYATIYREALQILADKNSTTVEQLEAEMIANAAVLARKGDYRFYKDILDRVHGTALSKTDITSDGKAINIIVPPAVAEAFNLNATTDSQTRGVHTEQE